MLMAHIEAALVLPDVSFFVPGINANAQHVWVDTSKNIYQVITL
jgi:hypothetical protein